MDTQQKVFVLKTTSKRTEGLDELNTHLSRGWRVVDVVPMGGAGAGSAGEEVVHLGAVVVVERAQAARAAVLEESEEEVDEAIGEMAEGNGAGMASEGGAAGEESCSETDRN